MKWGYREKVGRIETTHLPLSLYVLCIYVWCVCLWINSHRQNKICAVDNNLSRWKRRLFDKISRQLKCLRPESGSIVIVYYIYTHNTGHTMNDYDGDGGARPGPAYERLSHFERTNPSQNRQICYRFICIKDMARSDWSALLLFTHFESVCSTSTMGRD